MKRFSEAAAEVTAVAKRPARRAAPAVQTGEDARDPHSCHAYGCPLPGSISASTVGGGPWFCRFHFGARAAEWADITTSIRNGTLDLEHKGDSPAVKAAREMMDSTAARRERMAALGREREPGEDDE